MRQRLRLVGVVAALVLLGVAAAPAHAHPPVQRLGAGAGTGWVLWPRERPTSIVVFGHGWSTPLPTDGFAPWLTHLRARGSVVIYPQYRTSAAESVAVALSAFESGLQKGFAQVRGLHLPVVAIGKSFGGSAVFSYAASAAACAPGDPERVPRLAACSTASGRDLGQDIRRALRRRCGHDCRERRCERILALAGRACRGPETLRGHPLAAGIRGESRLRPTL
jgi:hypothetical protein